jgi:membrane associated rhomboid family serine protease
LALFTPAPTAAPAAAVWRLVTGHLWHAGALHLGLNLSALLPLGADLERGMGSVRFAHMLLLLAAAQDAAFVALAYGAA